ncbi:MAG: hypothetical protein ACYTG0_34720 [Planctomycetota bacterium]
MINPNVRAQVAVNPDSELIPVTRSGGVLSALAAPSGGLVSGTSAVLQLGGKLPLVVADDEIQEIQAAVAFAERQRVEMILFGGYDAPLCAALLK